ncbi:hypothetical protein [Streptomyces sp. NPDC051576]
MSWTTSDTGFGPGTVVAKNDASYGPGTVVAKNDAVVGQLVGV